METYFELLPGDINRELILKLDYPEIINLLETNKQFFKLKSNSRIWYSLLKRDFNMNKKDFDKLYFKNAKRAYQEYWTNINKSAEVLLKKIYINPKYANLANMKIDIITNIQNLIKENYTKGVIDTDDVHNLAKKIIDILAGVGAVDIYDEDFPWPNDYEIIEDELNDLFVDLDITVK